MLNPSLNELNLIAKSIGIKDYKSKSEDQLINILTEPKIEEIRKKKKMNQGTNFLSQK